MIFENPELQESLKTGFINSIHPSRPDYLPQLLHNDREKGTKILSSIQNELQKCDEFWFSVAFLTTSGVATLINTLSELEKRNIKGKILVSAYLYFTQPEALKRLLVFKNIDLRILMTGEFHSKGYLFKQGDIYNLIIGSSNLTQSALSTNKEWNLKVTATPQSKIIISALDLFNKEFNAASIVENELIRAYESKYNAKVKFERSIVQKDEELLIEQKIVPNKMQEDALINLDSIRSKGENKALLISATGTGKTYLSAFDAKVFKPKRLLFIVHRRNIAEAAMETFKKVFKNEKSYGLYSGNEQETDKDFLFSTIQTISRENHLENFKKDEFDYIVIDESHRAGAESYQKIFKYFEPKFYLGMTATPERTDGLDIFKLYNYNIAFEIRLHQAMEEDMLSPFHYYGVTDIEVEGKLLDDKADFNLLTSKERVDRILEKAEFYGCDDGEIRGIVFCSKVEECVQLSEVFNSRGYNSIALTGDSSDELRSSSISSLESDDPNRLKYIFTRDIFNEGIDIPRVNQVIMLRPTESAIVFVQQLGRGLRKTASKEYLTVIDFIGNYSNNYMVPIALYGDNSYNKDRLRKLLSSGSNLIPGSSTINFDEVSKKRIFESIDSAKLCLKKDLEKDFKLLKFKLGRIPMMMDFIEHGSRDPFLFVEYSSSYYNFVRSIDSSIDSLNSDQVKLLELFSNEINNGKRVEESELLNELIKRSNLNFEQFKNLIFNKYGYMPSESTYISCINNLNFEFVTESFEKKMIKVGVKYKLKVVDFDIKVCTLSSQMLEALEDSTFKDFLLDSICYSIKTFNATYSLSNFRDGFVLYQKYTRKDVFRILNWKTNPVAQNVGGYIISEDESNCPIFVNYHKAENISSTTKYEDKFVSPSEFEWMSKSKRTLISRDVNLIIHNQKMRIPLFIKKSNDEGIDFYFMGDIKPVPHSQEQKYLLNDDKSEVPVVKILFHLLNPVEDSIYNYITEL